MKQNRYLPFGYHIQNGALCVNEPEATVVRQIFSDYQAGMSYRLISEKLTAEKIPYLEHRTEWNKHMVKRMLENSRYCGDDKFPAIVPGATFAAVTALVGQKAQVERLPHELDSIRRKAICGACGAKYKRDGRSPKYEAWCCAAEGRITPKRISDQALLDSVTAALNSIIADPGLLDIAAPHPYEYSLDVTRTGNQINRELEKSEVDSDYVKLLIFSCAAVKYDTCNDREPEYLTRHLRKFFEQELPLEAFSLRLFESTVKQAIIESDGSLLLRMMNEKLVHYRAEKE